MWDWHTHRHTYKNFCDAGSVHYIKKHHLFITTLDCLILRGLYYSDQCPMSIHNMKLGLTFFPLFRILTYLPSGQASATSRSPLALAVTLKSLRLRSSLSSSSVRLRAARSGVARRPGVPRPDPDTDARDSRPGDWLVRFSLCIRTNKCYTLALI